MSTTSSGLRIRIVPMWYNQRLASVWSRCRTRTWRWSYHPIAPQWVYQWFGWLSLLHQCQAGWWLWLYCQDCCCWRCLFSSCTSWVSLRESAPHRRTALKRSSCSRRRTETLMPRCQTVRDWWQISRGGKEIRVKRPLRAFHCIDCWMADNDIDLRFNVVIFIFILFFKNLSSCICAKRESGKRRSNKIHKI